MNELPSTTTTMTIAQFIRLAKQKRKDRRAAAKKRQKRWNDFWRDMYFEKNILPYEKEGQE